MGRRRGVQKTGKVAVVVLSQPRAGRKPLRLVVMRFEDWQMNNAPRAGDAAPSAAIGSG
jgi:hypothetical protein